MSKILLALQEVSDQAESTRDASPHEVFLTIVVFALIIFGTMWLVTRGDDDPNHSDDTEA